MKRKLFLPLFIVTVAVTATLMWGCYGQTVEAFETFKFRFPVLFHAEYENKLAPDTSFDFVNMYEHDQYVEYKDKIDKAEVISFNYRIDSLIFWDDELKEEVSFDPVKHAGLIEFENIKFYLIFAKPKNPDDFASLDSSKFEADPDYPPYLLGEFRRVEVAEYYRFAHHIENIDESVAKVLEKALKDQPYFYLLTEYSKLKDQDLEAEPRRIFPYISARYDLIIRFSVSL